MKLFIFLCILISLLALARKLCKDTKEISMLEAMNRIRGTYDDKS